jgi:uncharacterized protein YbaP (TraB family)
MAAAKVSKKPIAGLETMEFQLGVFDTLPEAEQIAFLVEAAKMIDDTTSMMDKMVDMWGSADTESLAQLMNKRRVFVVVEAHGLECRLKTMH